MDSTHRIIFFKILSQILQTLKKIMGDFTQLFLLETELAKRSLKKIICFTLVLLISIISIWMLGIMMLAFWLHSMGWNIWISFLILMGFHLFLILISIGVIMKFKANLSFQVTRKKLSMLTRIK